MTTFNLEAPAGAWFDLEGGGRVCLRPMTPEAMRAIDKQASRKTVEFKRIDGKAERFEVMERDDDLHAALFWDHIIEAWEQFFDAKGEPIPCTRETKTLLMLRSQKFAGFVSECLKTLNEAQASAEEEQAKN